MKLKNLFLTIFLTITIVKLAISQFIPDNRVIPASPTAMSLVKDINIPINAYNGIAEINIPIITLTEANIIIPVSINYNASGIKVQDVASSVGLGWNLNFGGMITRVVKGLPDDDDDGFCGKNHRGASALNYTYANKIFEGDWDGEPDIFYYSFPGHKGKFIINHDRSVLLMPFSNIKIIPNFNNDKIEDFTIIDILGNIYKYSDKEISRSKISGEDEDERKVYTSTWYITEIKPLNTRRVISFTYRTGSPIRLFYYNNVKHQQPISSSETKVECKAKNVDIKIDNPKYINAINTSLGSVFFENFTRSDLANGLGVSSITVKNNANLLIKRVDFVYDYFICSDASTKHLKLTKVKETGTDLVLPPYEFYYNTTNLPPRDSPSFDFWGYYNTNLNDQCSGFERSPNFERTKAAILERIKIPTGGYKRFEYEQNLYGDGLMVAGGLRIKKIFVCDESSSNEKLFQEYEYLKKGSDKSSGYLFHTPQYYNYSHSYVAPFLYCQYIININYCVPFLLGGFISSSNSFIDYFDLNGYHIGYSEIKVKNPDGGSTELYFTNFNDQPDTDSKLYYNTTESNDFTFKNYHSTYKSPRFWRRGLLVSKVNRNSKNELIDSTYNLYGKIEINNTIVNGYRVELSSYNKLNSSDNKNNYNLFQFEYVSEYFPLIKTNSFNYEKNGVFDQEKKYLYNKVGQIWILEQNQSNGLFEKIEYKYPQDLNSLRLQFFPLDVPKDSISKAYYFMKLKNIHTPIEILQWKNDRLINGRIFHYKTANSGALYPMVFPAKEYSLNLMNSINDYEYAKLISQGLMPNKTWQYTFDDRYKLITIFDSYDSDGNLLQYHNENDINISYIWGYNQTQPIAEIKNATINSVAFTSFEGITAINGGGYYGEEWTCGYCRIHTDKGYTGRNCIENQGSTITSVKTLPAGKYKISMWAKVNPGYTSNGTIWITGQSIEPFWAGTTSWRFSERVINLTSPQQVVINANDNILIDELRLYPYDAQMTSYTYDPLIGMTSKTDENNRTTYYEYDDFGRLKTVKDDDGNILNHYQYRYHEVNFSLSNTLTGNNSYRFDITGDDVNSPSLSFEWNFGNGQTATTTTPTTTHTYSSSSGANYTVTVIVKSNGNIVKTLTTTVNSLGECTLSAMHLFDCDYQLRITGSNFNGANYTYEWNMGDGTVLNNNLWTMPYTFNATQTLNTYNVSVKIKYQGTVIRTLQTTVRCGLLEPDPRELLPI